MKKIYEKPVFVRKGKLSTVTALNSPSNPTPG
ncbi:MAG: putative RiPP precursor [Mesorhizobium sp.]|nr:putative RiPP precursor [Mesorhizobium sp.]RWL83686.1 MAG: putative RiPP precursor [Mesorhizobium sp.]RWL90838.1 MAG: putative RiPP precursor [Mesorhizobium sp.]RWL93324.1 MAG: putative RiPP precursor [Mesorhizobium sp.]RWL98499.1 MAG: putative RiPP precursor [Mesorhizobium sp.]TIO99657.1 MAG: putative RiPP precursor [Mesorhizobium sp.]